MRKKIICILCLALLLSGCGSSKSEEPFPTGGQRPGIPITPQPTATPTPSPRPTATPTITPSPTPTVSPTPTLIPGAKIAGWRKVEEVRWSLTEKRVETYWHYDKAGAEILVEEYEGWRLRKKVSTSYWKKDKIETQITSYYDEDGSEVRTEEKYTYDAAGNCVQVLTTRYESNVSQILKKASYEYHDNGVLKLSIVTDEEGETTTEVYNAFGEKLSERIEDGSSWETDTYQYENHLLIRKDWEYSSGFKGYFFCEYDEEGNLLKQEGRYDDCYACNTWGYGEFGIVWDECNYNNGEEIQRKEYTYNETGLKVCEKYFRNNELWQVYLYRYDEAGRLVERSSSMDGETFCVDQSYGYDDTGRLCYADYYNSYQGAHNYFYDDAGNLVEDVTSVDGELSEALSYYYEPIYDMSIGN